MTTVASIPAVSSSATLWATPSKEWVIPAKPKPGRKPKKDPLPPPTDDPEVDAKGRRVQNRAAQRAFRERKQNQLAELQLKVQQYEQGEIERNVALQNIAKRLKEENEKLRKENSLLQERLAAVEQERDTLREVSRKRWREEASPCNSDSAMNAPQPKRAKVSIDPFDAFNHEPATPTPYTSSPSSIASSPSSFEHSSFSPIPSLPPRDVPVFGQPNTLSNIFDFISSGKTNVFEAGGGLDNFNCGFCTDSTPCVCRELAMQSSAEQRFPAPPLKVEHTERRPLSLQADVQQLATPQAQPLLQSEQEHASILDNLPAYQPPVPLRRRNAGKPATNSIFPVSFPSSTAVPTCTGDPSNCPACADDAFGKAFCAAISKSVASNNPCNACPSRSGGGGCGSSGGGCCGNPAGCGSGRGSGSPAATANNAAAQSAPAAPAEPDDTISCDDAWRQIKSHPNVSFADLDLLADVVARRSKCTGPRVEIFPAPGSVTPERGLSPPTVPSVAAPSPTVAAPPADTRFPVPSRSGRHSPSLQLVPQEVLVQCGRQRVREVNADGVRDALRLLDLKFSLP
ncbi:bZIP domain-containing protein [Phanerochaete sordida]|uniref:BZIP domain-containing protein n=1 Tax=Phanerochaete sordida TaxID=48140 RepID=A0A9P3G128_9APHY|nr:bZIP domain-containing protein [Phanerochaete sordida]